MKDPVKAVALFAALQATFFDVHPYFDQIVQNSHDALNKGLHGSHLVWPDGVKVGEEDEDRSGQPTMIASQLGRTCAARHVATYSLGQLAAAWGVSRALGVRVPLTGLLAGTMINGVTHYAIDRRQGFTKFLRSKLIGKGSYLDRATVQRRPGVIDEVGPGTALMECDQAAHRVISIVASLKTTWLALRERS